jgi:hypothetical protein
MAFRGGMNFLFLWPTCSFGVVSIAYFTGNARWFGKRRDGTRHVLATFVLLPYLTFVYGVWRCQIVLSREPAFHRVNAFLIVARRLLKREYPGNVDRVCDLTCEFLDPKLIRTKSGYLCLPILDAGTCSARELIELAHRLPPLDGELLLIHCANGHGRTGMVAAVWLLTHRFARSVDEAMTILQRARPGIGLRSRQLCVVEEAFTLLGDSIDWGEIEHRDAR